MDKLKIQQARQTDLAQYLLSRGEKLIHNGQRFRHAEHKSLVFTGNAYYWNAKNEQGNAIDFLMSFYNMSFENAVNELIGFNIKEPFSGQQKKISDQPSVIQTFSLKNMALCTDMRRAVAYLTKTRHIDYNIVQRLIKRQYIFQENQTNNIIFPIYDERRQLVGAELTGTLSDKRFKGVAAGSRYGYGFNITIGEPLKYALFFESAIDLISFIELELRNKKLLTGCLLVSMAGLKENIIQCSLNAFKGTVDALYPILLCVDGDQAGKNFVASVRMQNKGILERLPSSGFKDWNEQLIALKN